MIKKEGILYIEPSPKVSAQPLIDSLTRRMTAAFRQAKEGTRWRGVHTCACGAHSDNCDYTLPNGELTNSLCIHYLAFHRSDVPKFQLEKVRMLESGEAEPNERELADPQRKDEPVPRPKVYRGKPAVDPDDVYRGG